ncbi:hypothetical protein HYU40_01685 [Candidatus Woesearchaeota archaeon]|nr:hypothetical protein [Candidatus Woesearchaeota archaeon]
MSVNIEVLIEIKATRTLADEVAKRVKEEFGLEARVGNGAAKSHSPPNGKVNDRRNRHYDVANVAQRTIVATGTSADYGKAERRINQLRGMLKPYTGAVLAASCIYEGDKKQPAQGET